MTEHSRPYGEQESRNRILTAVRRIATEHLGRSGVKIYLFGSWARGDEGRTSDIYLGVWSAQGLTPGVLAKLRQAFEESRIPYRVEIVDLNQSDDALRQRVFAEGCEWTV